MERFNMKFNKIISLMLFIFTTATAIAQNVGINITNPQSTLDVRGNQRFGGLSKFITYDSVTGKIVWTNSNLFVPVSQYLMQHSASAEGLYYGNSQLEYRNSSGTPVFFTNWNSGNGYFNNYLGIGTATPLTNLHIEANNMNPIHVNGGNNVFLSWAENGVNRGYVGSYAGNPEDVDFGTYLDNPGKIHFTTDNIPRMTIVPSGNVGIGTTDPTNPLSFPPILSKKISLYPGSSGDAGLGVSGNLLKIYSDHSNADIALGYDDYTNGFIERMRVKGNGYVGIGRSNPFAPLSFANTTGQKITLFGDNHPNYGIGIQPSLLQIHTDAASSDIAFGYGSSGSFTQRFRMKGNGTLRIEGPASFGTAIPALSIGGAGDVQVDANGVAGGRLTIKENGAISIGGSSGATGQVLQSTGPGSSPSWANPLNAFYNNMVEYTQSAPVVMVPQTSYAIPGISNISLVITSVSKIIISSSIEVERSSCGGCGSSEEHLFVQIVSPFVTTLVSSKLFLFPSETSTLTTAMKFITLNPNTYTINTYVASGVGSNATARSGRLNIVVVPQ